MRGMRRFIKRLNLSKINAKTHATVRLTKTARKPIIKLLNKPGGAIRIPGKRAEINPIKTHKFELSMRIISVFESKISIKAS
jgi:hypothetical protein